MRTPLKWEAFYENSHRKLIFLSTSSLSKCNIFRTKSPKPLQPFLINQDKDKIKFIQTFKRHRKLPLSIVVGQWNNVIRLVGFKSTPVTLLASSEHSAVKRIAFINKFQRVGISYSTQHNITKLHSYSLYVNQH